MIRLAIRGIQESERQPLSVRLRQTCLVESPAACRTEPPEDCDAIAFPEFDPADKHLIKRCLTNGVHVCVAASQNLSGDDLSHLRSLAAISRVQFCVVNPDRCLPSRRLIHDQIIAGHLGAPGLIRSHRWESRETAAGHDRNVPDPLIRDLELSSWLFGAFPERVNAVECTAAQPATSSRAGDAGKQDGNKTVLVHLGFQGGGMALVDYSSRLQSGSGYQMLSVVGSAGVACTDDHRNLQLLCSGGKPQGLLSDERTRRLVNMIQEFVDNLVAGKDLSPSVSEWQAALQLAAAVRRSLDSRKPVSLTLKEQ